MNTRHKILKAAWELFGDNGFETVSVRDLTQHANVNVAAINYHFGNKDGLIQEIVAEALIPLNRQRVTLLKKAGDAQGGVENVSLRTMIESYLHPVIFPQNHGGCPGMIARIMARYLIDSNYDVPDKVTSSFRDIFQIFGIVVQARCPNLDPKKAIEKLIFSTGAAFMFQSFSDLASKTMGSEETLTLEEQFSNVVTFCEQGFHSN